MALSGAVPPPAQWHDGGCERPASCRYGADACVPYQAARTAPPPPVAHGHIGTASAAPFAPARSIAVLRSSPESQTTPSAQQRGHVALLCTFATVQLPWMPPYHYYTPFSRTNGRSPKRVRWAGAGILCNRYRSRKEANDAATVHFGERNGRASG